MRFSWDWSGILMLTLWHFPVGCHKCIVGMASKCSFLVQVIPLFPDSVWWYVADTFWVQAVCTTRKPECATLDAHPIFVGVFPSKLIHCYDGINDFWFFVTWHNGVYPFCVEPT